MQSTREPVIPLFGHQQPVVSLEQMVPGVIITGVALQHAWEIVEIRDGEVWLKRLPANPTLGEHRHTFQAYGRGQVCSVCNMRRQRMDEFLPRVADRPRAYVIAPQGTLLPPQPFTLYGAIGRDNTLKTCWLDGQETPAWSETLPLIPRLHILWTIPIGLRDLLNGEAPELEEAEEQYNEED